MFGSILTERSLSYALDFDSAMKSIVEGRLLDPQARPFLQRQQPGFAALGCLKFRSND